MEKFKNIYRILSARAAWWNYGNEAAYFITICTKNRKCYFGEIEDRKMKLSHLGLLADVLWHEIKNHAKNITLEAFVVMPNHIHGILVLDGDEKNDVPLHSVETTDSVETTHALSLQHQQQQQSEEQPEEIMQSLQTIEYKQWNLSEKTPGQKRYQHQGAHTVSSIIGSYKSAVTKHAHRLGYDFEWQDRFHDHIIRDDAKYRRIAHYIETNVENWETDCFFGDK